MANTGIDTLLVPEFWATAFDELDTGQYPLKNLVNRKYESAVAQSGDTVHVPLTPNFVANDYDGIAATTPQDITQTEAQVTLNQSKEVTFNLTNKELTLTPYELIQSYGVPAVEALMGAIESSIYTEFLKGIYFTDGRTTFTEDTVVDMQTALSNRKISKMQRKFVGAPDEIGALMKADAFQHVNITGQDDVMREGFLGRRFGLDFFESNGIETYTPADLVGAVNNVGGYPLGTSTIIVNGFVDPVASGAIKTGDIFTVAGDTTVHTVVSTVRTADATTTITFSPALGAAVVDTAVITIVPTRSGIAFSPNALAFAARPYVAMPEGTGVRTTVSSIQGMPVRINVWHNGNLGLKIQFDTLFGHTLIDGSRVQRVIID